MPAQNFPLVSIISINFNQLQVTCDMLDSLTKITYPNYEVIIVDNDSYLDPTERIESNYPHVKLIKSDQNLGFAGGNNLGIRQAKGKYFMMLNNDTEVDPHFLEPLVEAMEKNSRIGMVGSKVRFFEFPDTIQFAGATPMTKFTATSHFIGYNTKDVGQFEEMLPSPFASGAAMMTSRKICEEIGLMAEFFFLYYEELDWQERIRKAGYLIYYIPKSIVFHKESVSVGKESALQAYWRNRNRLLLIRRNFGWFPVSFSFVYLTLIAAPYKTIKYSLKGDWQFLKVYFIALGWHYKNLINTKRVHHNDFL
jgi:GT2 family glycosyltransferase